MYCFGFSWGCFMNSEIKIAEELKTCVKCAHHHVTETTHICLRKEGQKINLVTGLLVTKFCEAERIGIKCNYCGEEGRYFKPAPPAPDRQKYSSSYLPNLKCLDFITGVEKSIPYQGLKKRGYVPSVVEVGVTIGIVIAVIGYVLLHFFK